MPEYASAIVYISGLSVYSFFLSIFLFITPSLHAIEFSAIQLFSGFNEPLHAEIEVSGLTDPDAPVVVDVASPLEHQNYDVPVQYFNAAINTSWHQAADGRRIIRLTSALPVSLENLDFLLMAIPTDETVLMRVQIPITQSGSGKQHSQPRLRVQNANGTNTAERPLTRFNEPLAKNKKQTFRNKQKIVAAKRQNRLKRTAELARANRQVDANARVLAFNSVVDEISYNPHFSKQAISAVLHEDRETDKAQVSNKPRLALESTTDNKTYDKIKMNNDENKSINLDIKERLTDKINPFFAVQTVQSDIAVSLLGELLLSTAYPKMNVQTLTKQMNPQICVFKNASKAIIATNMVVTRLEDTTITPFLGYVSQSLIVFSRDKFTDHFVV
ncbi:hypothetical protein GCM10023116_28220 [Kistimonas scapharcae]|uniref:FimV N-terminal domain-containing protein n=1 Tax=Kistimonas scapharcae TaxID=1036133 RepID=A0ABP8V4R5_9GAMM